MAEIVPYKGNDSYIFISYAHRDAATVIPILERMYSDGFRVWYDEGIDPGTEWDMFIADHIVGCGYFIAFMSNNYLASSNCKDELNYARDLEKNRLIVYLEDVTLPTGMAMRINRLQSVFHHKYVDKEKFYEALYRANDLAEHRGAPTVTEHREAVSQVSDNRRETPSQFCSAGSGTVKKEIKKLTFDVGEYEGEVAYGMPNGRGVCRYVDGSIYDGEWKDNNFHGHGTLRLAHGDTYEGGWKDGVFNGYGVYSWSIGEVYEGSWKDGKYDGRGIYRYADGSYYEGEWKDDQRDGRGFCRYPDGSTYDGEWKYGREDGSGIFTAKNGVRYRAIYRNGTEISKVRIS